MWQINGYPYLLFFTLRKKVTILHFCYSFYWRCLFICTSLWYIKVVW